MAAGSWSVTRSRCGGSSGVCTLSGTATASPDEGFQEALSCSSGSSSCAMALLWVLLFSDTSVGLRGDPHRDGDQRADAEDPDEETFGDGAEGAQREAADRHGVLLEEQRRDDVALVLRGEVHVAEDRHVLGSGDHRGVHVQRAGLVEGGSVLALRQGAAGAG